MENIKRFSEFNQLKERVATDEAFKKRLKDDPEKALDEINLSGPIYTSDKLVYRIVIFGFAGTLLFGMMYCIYQYQQSLDVRATYAKSVIESIKGISSSDSLSFQKLTMLKDAVSNASGLNATIPDGIIAVFTGIIGALAGLFAPSPLRSNDPSSH